MTAHAYALAMRDFLWSIPDTHVGFDQSCCRPIFKRMSPGAGLWDAGDRRRQDHSELHYGGRASGEGRDEVGSADRSFDGTPIADVVSATVPWSSPFSNPIIKRLQQFRYATRFKMDKGKVTVVFSNPGGRSRLRNWTW